ncbi:acyl-CoA dehydrogenase [Amycolatopsis balhimycina DSM 5908]|uniref:Acyl-CoA dehydrogenase n=1 Tax=Amycolatopsis balhimycina DSM 5908 TaxID=1081091 RepID=A0A428VZE5_AMYBA|nr:acyl-CoA dehydrogenase [Amycolatopsis balhimycina]RSM36177.1 acyl-CoA dehydrogenase [Amycolatopsis balhimycina DSM 5908]
MSAAELDALLGDAWDDRNPVGHAAVLAADERQEMLAEGERVLDRYGLNAEFVPVAYGGRWERADRLAEILRTVWRRDPCLGLGYGFSSLIASVNIWTAGNEDQRRRTAGLLLANGRVAAAFHELAHGNDFAHAECVARPGGGGWLLSGRKEIVTNLRRAEAMVLFARTGSAPGSRSHSQFLVLRGDRPITGLRDLPRFPSSGMRGVQLGGVAFDRSPIPGDALIGSPGQGIEVALRSYQVTRSVAGAMFAGPLETALRLAIRCALERHLYGGTAADLPYVRAVIARAYADLLAVDAFSAVILRSLHLEPETMAVYAPAAKYLTARIALDAFEDLRAVLGARSYLRRGPYAMFQKLARDVTPATFAHVSLAAALVTLLPQLPRLARKSWLADPSTAPSLFDVGGDLPALSLDRLSAGMPKHDGIIGALTEMAAAGSRPGSDPVRRFTVRCEQELRKLRDGCAALGPADITIDASPAAFALADRYTAVLAAASVLAVWWHGGERHGDAAVLGVLDRLTERMGGPAVLTPAERDDVEQRLFDCAVAHSLDGRPLGLSALGVPDRARSRG